MVGILFLLSIIIKPNFASIFVLILLIGFTGYFIVKIVLEIKKISKVMISINRKGIQIKDQPIYVWDEIQLEKITSKHLVSRESKRDYKPEINYLYFFHNNEKIEIKIDDFDISNYQFAQVLKIFRSRHNNSIL